MIITTTGVAFTLLALGLAVCGFLFLRAFRKAEHTEVDRNIGFLLSAIFFGFSIQNGIMGLGALFLVAHPQALFFIVLAAHLFLAALAMLGVYTSYYIFSPQESPALPVSLVGGVGLLAIIVTYVVHPLPFLTAENGLDWNLGLRLSMMTFYLLFISIGSTTYIFGKLYRSATTPTLKNLSLALSGLGVAGVLNVFVRLIVLQKTSFALRTQLLDIGIGLIGAAFIVFLVIPLLFKKRI